MKYFEAPIAGAKRPGLARRLAQAWERLTAAARPQEGRKRLLPGQYPHSDWTTVYPPKKGG